MAIKRMFNKNITDSDRFADLSAQSQALYFHLNLKADDEGFVGSPNTMIKMLDLKKEYFLELVEKEYIIEFESGICVIRHWNIHNSIRKDRVRETIYQQEKAMVYVDSRKMYMPKDSEKPAEKAIEMPVSAERLPSDGQMSAQNRLDKDRIDKDRIDKNRTDKQSKVTKCVSVCDNKLQEILQNDISHLPRAQTLRALGKYMNQMDFECIEYAIEQSDIGTSKVSATCALY